MQGRRARGFRNRGARALWRAVVVGAARNGNGRKTGRTVTG